MLCIFCVFHSLSAQRTITHLQDELRTANSDCQRAIDTKKTLEHDMRVLLQQKDVSTNEMIQLHWYGVSFVS